MQVARFVRTLGLLLVLGIASVMGGCGPESQPMSEADNQQVKEYHKGVHQQLKENAKQARQDVTNQRGSKGAANRKPAGE